MSAKNSKQVHKSFWTETREVVTSSLRFFRVHPISIVPLLLCWCVYATTILYMEYFFDWEMYSGTINVLICFGCFLLFSMVYGIACLILLEMVQQIEKGKKVSLLRASRDAIFRDFWKACPVLLTWAIIWFVLSLLSALFSRNKDKNGTKEISAHSAVGTLLGSDETVNSISAFFNVISKGVRMVTFLILPAIVWEDMGPIKAFKKGLVVLKNAKGSFLVDYGTTGLFAIFVLFVPALIFKINSDFELNLPESFWYVVLIYVAFASSLSFLVEQLYVAQLYLWHMVWEKENTQNGTNKSFESTEKPSFFDGINDME